MQATQKGSALIIVLLILVMMILMGFALMRSTETATLISGNVATKQAATQAAEVGLQVAEAALKSINENGALDTTDSSQSYCSTALVLVSGIPTATNACPWSGVTALSNGLSYQYLIERLCNASSVCTINTDSEGEHTMFRITIKITGPRNTESYIQASYGI